MITSQKLLHRSRDYSNLLNNIIENELTITSSNNEVLWVAMGNELETHGVEKSQISTIVRKDIEDRLWEEQFKTEYTREDYRYCNSKYYEVMKSNGWTNPFMARNTNGNLDPRMEQDNSSINTRNNDMIILCDDIIDICKTIKDKSKDDGTPPFEESFGEKKMKEFYKQRRTIINNCKNSIDNKTKIPKNTEIFLLECLATILGSTNKCAQIFMEQNLIHLKEQGKFLTLKQATKFQKGMRQSQLFILKPTSRDQALFLDYTGVQCTCTSWRVRQRLDSYKLECYDCDSILPPSHISKCNNCQIPLYKERLLYMINNKNKCENCETRNDLPEELIQYAKS